MYLSSLSLLSLAGFALLSGAAAVRDIRTTTIPNGVILMLLAGYLLVAAASGWTRDEITNSLIAAAMVFFTGLMLNAMGWLPWQRGTQLVKFAAVCCLWLGAPLAVTLMGLSALIAVTSAILLLCLPQIPAQRTNNQRAWPDTARRQIPAGFAVAAAAVLLLPASPWVMSVS